MRTEILSVDPASPQADVIARAAAVLRRGGLVVFPTETVYGVGANALDADAVGRIFEAKGRPATNPVIVHITRVEQIRPVAEWPETAARLAERFWPGPLTLVLPRREAVPDVVTAGGPTVAVRMPSHPVARSLIDAAGVPVAAPSANRSTELSPTLAEHVLRGLDGRIDLLLDGGPTPGGLESTVVDATSDPPRLLRPGLVSVADLEAVVGRILLPGKQPTDSPLPSPGMMPRHYAPLTPLELADDNGARRLRELLAEGRRVAWLTWDLGTPEIANVPVVRLPLDPSACAAMLYATLHALDERGLERIVVASPPDGPEWLAIRDRLRRAASPAGLA
jgi:L-threonylcarbamoyladenylate synthase